MRRTSSNLHNAVPQSPQFTEFAAGFYFVTLLLMTFINPIGNISGPQRCVCACMYLTLIKCNGVCCTFC